MDDYPQRAGPGCQTEPGETQGFKHIGITPKSFKGPTASKCCLADIAATSVIAAVPITTRQKRPGACGEATIEESTPGSSVTVGVPTLAVSLRTRTWKSFALISPR